MPTAGVVVMDNAGRLLLVQRADDLSWCLPGGRLEPGESLAECAMRECREETGLPCEIGQLIGIYSDPVTQRHRYGDGDEVQFVAAVFGATVPGDRGIGDDHGDATEPDRSEILRCGFFALAALPAPIMGCDTPIVAGVVERTPTPRVG